MTAAVSHAAGYLGREVCRECHVQQDSQWQGSPHDLAMQEANEKTVLGDFSNVMFTQFDVTSRFFHKDGKFMVRTDGPDGKLHDYVISYTFGFYPLQQYLVSFPGGRLQVLDIAWDSRPRKEGGQRWFHLHPDEKTSAGDVLHWTGPNLNWNYMCADCHSTHLKKNYDVVSHSYRTRWSEIDVSCEACHGPGSAHVGWARAAASGKEVKVENKGLTVALAERKNVKWAIDDATHKPVRSRPNESRAETEVCARCHSRRSQLGDDFIPGQPFMNAYHPALLAQGLYFPDGQMQDEVYVWGSFRQSRMFHQGVTCSDCHDPHAAQLRAPGEQVCYQCHAAQKYAGSGHHHHETGSPGSSCVSCHMPATTFMGVDERHDHSFRIPRPDLSKALDTPNACNACHADKTPDWAMQVLTKWYGHEPAGFQEFASILQAGRQQTPGSYDDLLKLALNPDQPVIARATALSFLPGAISQTSMLALQQLLNAGEPLLRLGALAAMASAPQAQRILALPLVWDKIKTIRIEAARLLAGYPRDSFKPGQAEVLDKVIQEYIQTQEFNAERPEAQVNLGNLYTSLARFNKAEAAYREALRLQPKYVPAYVNFAQMLSQQDRENEASDVLLAGTKQVPDSADLYHALGLSKVRQKAVADAIPLLAKAAKLDADNRHYPYVYAVALHSTGKLDQAIAVLEKIRVKYPDDVDTLYALATFHRDAGQRDEALAYARRLAKLMPTDPGVMKLMLSLEQGSR
ncbi:tetratricopeptide repeat protein [Thiolapillus sp.]